MANRSNSPGRSNVSQHVFDRLENHSSTFDRRYVVNVHHYNSRQDQVRGRYANDNSQIVRTRSPGGTTREYHSHDRGRIYTGYSTIR